MAEDKPKNDELDDVFEKSKRRAAGSINFYNFPWWLVVMVLGWAWVIYLMQSNQDYSDAFRQIQAGIPLTLWLAIASYILALAVGLVVGLIRAYPPEPPETRLSIGQQVFKFFHLVVYTLTSVYVEFMRGIPSLVFLLIVGFIIVPAIRTPFENILNVTWLPFYNTALVPLLNALFNHEVNLPIIGGLFQEYETSTSIVWRGRDPGTAIAGLTIIYGAFLAEVFRAGIQSVPKGQVEAAKSLGMTNFQTIRHIVIPQAVRNVLPPLGNDFIAMIKDTSLVTILGTDDITQLARRWSGSQFTYLETYAVLSLIYLTMTVTGSLLVQLMERNLRRFAKR